MIAKKDSLSFDPHLEPNIKGGPNLPPPANRGVNPTPQLVNPYGEPVTRGVDWLSVTMGEQAAKYAIFKTIPGEDGRPNQGFAKSETRGIICGHVGAKSTWRKYDPYSSSKRWGLKYESWETHGAAAHHMAQLLMAGPHHDMRPSRVDIAWDHHVEESDDADTFTDIVRQHITDKGIIPNDAGPENNHTKYIGSRESARYLRVYRKDRHQPQFFTVPTLRLEMVLRDELAAAWWRLYCEDEHKSYGAAAAHLFDLTGFEVQEQADIPEPEAKPDTKATDTLFYAIKQYGMVIDAALSAGVDVEGLCRLRRETGYRHAQLKNKRALQEFISCGIRETEEYLSGRIV